MASSRPQVDRKSEDSESLEKVRLPLSLNLSQCLLELQQHQRVVELNDKLLEKHKGSTHVQIWAGFPSLPHARLYFELEKH